MGACLPNCREPHGNCMTYMGSEVIEGLSSWRAVVTQAMLRMGVFGKVLLV